MARCIEMVFHVGFGKTATTFLQANFEHLEDTLFIGKFTKLNEKNSRFLSSISDSHLKLFRTYRYEVVKGFSNPSRSSADLVANYVKGLVQLVNKHQANRVIISDECIADYGNYIGEWNLFLQIAIGNLLELELSKHGAQLKKTLCFTIRNQLDITKSMVGYSEHIPFKGVDDFFSTLIRDKDNSKIGALGTF